MCSIDTGQWTGVALQLHSPRSNLNLLIKIIKSRVCHGWRRCNGICLVFVYIMFVAHKPDICRCICFNCDTATGSVLIRKFRVFVGTVWPCPVRIICGDRHSVAWSSKDDRIFWSLGQPQYIRQQVKNVSSQPDSNPWTPNHLLSRHLDFLCL